MKTDYMNAGQPMTNTECDSRPHILYRAYNTHGELLYVGLDVASRLVYQPHTQPWTATIALIVLSRFTSRTDALRAERNAIETESPQHNVTHSPTQRPVRRAPEPPVLAWRLHHYADRTHRTLHQSITHLLTTALDAEGNEPNGEEEPHHDT